MQVKLMEILPWNNLLKSNYVSSSFIIYSPLAILTQKSYQEEQEFRRKILDEFVVPTVDAELNNLNPYMGPVSLSKEEIEEQLQKTKIKNSFLRKNIANLKA